MRTLTKSECLLTILILAGCSSKSPKEPPRPTAEKSIKQVQPEKTVEKPVAPIEKPVSTGQMDRIEDALGPWPASLAFYEKRPINRDRRHRMAVSLTGERLPFLIRFDLAEDGQTVKRVICTGIKSDEACGGLAHHLSVAIADAVIGGRNMREAIYDVIMQEATVADRSVPGWQLELTQLSESLVFTMTRLVD